MTSTFPAVTKRKPALASLLLQKCKFNIFKVKQEKKKDNKIQMQNLWLCGWHPLLVCTKFFQWKTVKLVSDSV